MRPLVIRPEATEDLAQARDWYDSKVAGLGANFLEQVDSVFLRIETLPEAPAMIYQDVRFISVHRFPYGVFYRVLQDRIDLLAVIHGRRSSRIWKERLT